MNIRQWFTTRWSYVYNPIIKYSGASQKFYIFFLKIWMVSDKTIYRAFRVHQRYKQNPSEKIFIFNIYQNYTLALNCCGWVCRAKITYHLRMDKSPVWFHWNIYLYKRIQVFQVFSLQSINNYRSLISEFCLVGLYGNMYLCHLWRVNAPVACSWQYSHYFKVYLYPNFFIYVKGTHCRSPLREFSEKMFIK